MVCVAMSSFLYSLTVRVPEELTEVFRDGLPKSTQVSKCSVGREHSSKARRTQSREGSVMSLGLKPMLSSLIGRIGM